MNKIEVMPRVRKVIDVYADVACPFTHVGLTFLANYREEIGRDDVALRVHAWPLELVNGEPLGPDLLTDEIAELRAKVAPDRFAGFDSTLFPMTSMPALALEASAYSVDLHLGERISLALRHALFEEGRDISAAEELETIAESFGIAPPGLDGDAKVLEDWSAGKARGVIGSPHFFVGEQSFFCPSLEIEHIGGQLSIAVDRTGFDRFVDHCFETDGR